MSDPALWARLREGANAVLDVDGRSAREIVGYPDDRELRSCATLFARVSQDTVFGQLLEKYYGGSLMKRRCGCSPPHAAGTTRGLP